MPPALLQPYEARAWSATAADEFSPLFRSALSQSQLARQRQQGAGAPTSVRAHPGAKRRDSVRPNVFAEDAASSRASPVAAGGSGVRAALARLLLGQRRQTASEG